MAIQNTIPCHERTKKPHLTQDPLELMETSKMVSTSGRSGLLITVKHFKVFFRNSTENSFKIILLLAYVSIHPEKSCYLRKIKRQQELNEKRVFLGGSLSSNENDVIG